MILSKKLSEAFNAQVNAEMWSSNLYLSMSVHFQKLGLNGFAHWMKKQAEEEMEHAHKMIDFTIDRGGDITIGQINGRSYCMGQRHRIIRTCLQTRMLRFRTDRQNGRYRRRR